MSQKPKLFLAESLDFNKDVLILLKEHAEVITNDKTEINLPTILLENDIFWFRLGHKIDKEVLNESSRCRILVTPVTGLDHVDENLCNELGVEIISLRGESEFLKEVRATAEMTLALTLALLRNLIPARNSVLEGVWNRDKFRGSEVYKKNVGIIGVGRLGKITAEYFKALGANVKGYDPREDFPDNIDRADSLKGLLETSDIVLLHLKLDESTENLISEEEFDWFKDGSILINTSRGGVLDEHALLDALKSKKLSGAALDVIKGENEIQDDNALIKYAKENSNLIITPHIGGNTYESFEKTERFIADKLIQRIKSFYD